MTLALTIFAMFPGQGSQKVGMGKDLYEGSEMAREYFERANESLGFSVSELCFNGPIEKLTLTEIAQPALLTVSTICFRLSRERFNPIVAAGHSLGEYSALVAAEALQFDDAVRLVHKRGKYMQEAVQPGEGKMVAVLGKEILEIEEAIQQTTAGAAEIANINAPGQVVVSGSVEGINEFVARLGSAKVIPLQVSAPFHSSLMKRAEERLADDLEALTIEAAKFPVYSNYSAEPLIEPEKIREALRLQVCGRVRWVECVENAIATYDIKTAVEFGTGATLTGLLKRISPQTKGVNMDSLDKISQT